MPKIPGVNHLRAVRALEKDAGLTEQDFKDLL